ncbi:MAG: hypothetical protein K0R82_1093 [Flavipsychrobacter sp.]|nr:hypothetical protein [Flavipsychrobacter sp.]
MKEFFRFMSGGAGRWLRGIIGFALLAWGYNYAGGVNITLIIAGLIPLTTAIFDFYLLAPLFGYPVGGRAIREKLGPRGEPGEA